MAAPGAGPTSRSLGSRAKNRPIPRGVVAAGPSRPAVPLTAGRIKGVEPSSRTAEATPRKTSSITPSPRTSPAPAAGPEVALIAEAVATALGSLGALEWHIEEVADAFRWGRIAEGHRGLTDLVQNIRMLLKLASMTAQATGNDLQSLCGPDGLRADEDTRSAVELVIERQMSDDWAGLADALEQELMYALTQWRLVFEALGASLTDDDPPGRAA
jgi:hypothetical protein